MNDLTILATGLYGNDLPPQNVAPLRLVVPWKYGFKSIKATVRIDLVAEQPPTLWSTVAPHEYGFYANVNPNVSHPRWSQYTERRIGETGRRPTLMLSLMSVTALLSGFAAYIAYRPGWIDRSPHIRWILMGGYGFSGLLVFLNVSVIARLMFASRHDLLLATALLVFATGIALAVGFLLPQAITDRILLLGEAAKKVAQGKLDLRVPPAGRDEISGLAAAFNEMVSQLETAGQRQRELNALRRDLIAWIGHDLRTPLISIRAILEGLADVMVDDPATLRRYLETAQRDIRSLSNLTDDLFEMSLIDAGGLKLELQPNSLGDLVSDTIESFSELASRQGVVLGAV